MTVTVEGIALAERKEGCRLTAYYDDAHVLTIGRGHTGPDVIEGESITQEEADMLFRRDITRFDVCVGQVCPDATPQQHSAMVVLCYNIGEGTADGKKPGFRTSSVARCHNAGDFAGAARAFSQWNKIHVAGRLTVSPGLTRRRAEEAALYLSDTPETNEPESAAASGATATPLALSKTAAAAATSAVATSAGTLSEHAGFVKDLQDQLSAAVPYLPQAGIMLLALGVFGAVAAWYFRYRDHKNGLN